MLLTGGRGFFVVSPLSKFAARSAIMITAACSGFRVRNRQVDGAGQRVSDQICDHFRDLKTKKPVVTGFFEGVNLAPTGVERLQVGPGRSRKLLQNLAACVLPTPRSPARSPRKLSNIGQSVRLLLDGPNEKEAAALRACRRTYYARPGRLSPPKHQVPEGDGSPLGKKR